MSSPPPLPIPAAPPPPLADFGDWLSPMIVKELRQGLRTWVFVGAFIVLQAILVMTLLISASAGNAQAASSLFWILIAGILVFIIPLRGFNALAGEMKAETLDLLMLTRLGAFRIALGKWIALTAQGALIAISVLPYVVLRYFGGGVDVASELVALLLFWMLSAAVTAVAVAFSALPSVIVRTLVLLATWFWSMTACGLVMAATLVRSGGNIFGVSGGDPPKLWIMLAILTPLWAYGCYFVLDVGASAIAPLAANHATRKRLISLLMMVVALAFVLAWPDHDGRSLAMGCLGAVAALCALDCLTETPTASPSVSAPFVRRGAFGRLAAYFLTPGWPTGLLFCLLIAALVTAGLYRMDALNDAQGRLLSANLLLTPFTPLALALLFFRQSHRLLGPYLICSIIILIASALLLLMMTVGREEAVGYAGAVSPPTALMLHGGVDGKTGEKMVLAGGLASGLLFLLFLLGKAAAHFKRLHRVMRPAAGADTGAGAGAVAQGKAGGGG